MYTWKLYTFIVLFIFIVPICVNAEEYIINNNGVKINKEDFNKIKEIYTEAYAYNLNKQDYDIIKDNLDNYVKETKYIESSHNKRLGIISERLLSKNEYNNVSRSDEASTQIIETTYKELTIVVVPNDNFRHIVLVAIWKIMPSTRSYDVIGVRLLGYNYSHESVSGYQSYHLNGEAHTINYAYNGTNTSIQTLGYGTSMNLVNDDVESLECGTSLIASRLTGGNHVIYGSYQHAVNNVSLAQSKNYTIGPSGIGEVFVWPYSVTQNYDLMNGVYIMG